MINGPLWRARINSNDSQKSRLSLHIVCWEESGGAEFLSPSPPQQKHQTRALSHTCKLFWPYTARIRRAFLNANWTKLYLALRRRLRLCYKCKFIHDGIWYSFFSAAPTRGLCIKFCTRRENKLFEGKLSSSLRHSGRNH